MALSCKVVHYNGVMRVSRTLSVTLPPEMLSRAEALARKDNRTMSELFREALRVYERHRWWEEVNALGRMSAERAGIRTEEDLLAAIHDLRRNKRRKAGKP